MLFRSHRKTRCERERRKPNRLVVYLPDELYEKVRQLMTACGFATVQDFLETSIAGIVEEASKREMV